MWMCAAAFLLLLAAAASTAKLSDFYEVDGLDYNHDSHLVVKRSVKKVLDASEKKPFGPKDSNGGFTEMEVVNRTEAEIELGITIPPSNLTIEEDYHQYYNSTFSKDLSTLVHLYVDLNSVPDQSRVITHPLLSTTYRKAMTISLSFDFPFYGDPIKNVTIATGGFLYVGEYMHNWIAATQYIAPLMANFDPSLNNDSAISYYDNGTALTVEWKNVIISDHPTAGAFTFQTTLYQNGNIAFVYIDIPMPVKSISNESHPVKVGLSDAYILEKQQFIFKRKIVFEYHKINVMNYDIGSKTALLFKALPTCSGFTNCTSCQSAEVGFSCFWCPSLNRCSTSIDRHRQEWLQHLCVYQIRPCDPEEEETTTETINGHDTTVLPPKEAITTKAPISVPSSTPPETSTVATTTSVLPHTSSPTISTTTAKVEPSSGSYPSQETTPSVQVSTPAGSEDDSSSDRPFQGEQGPNTFYQPIADSQVYTNEEEEKDDTMSGMSAGSVIAILMAVLAILAISGWVAYAYKYPHTFSGQILIKYRPSQWRWSSKPTEQPALQM